MATLQWSTALELNVPAMDETHKEFVELLSAAEAASDAVLPELWQSLLVHTEGHFGQEDRWMQVCGFAVENCHASQHQVVLEIMREGAKKMANGDCTMVRGMLPELASWFNYHAQTMDAALAQHMHSVGFDPITQAVRHSEALPSALISSCGGACSIPDDHAQHAAQSQKVAQAAI